MFTRCLLFTLAGLCAIAHAENPPVSKPASAQLRFSTYDVDPKNGTVTVQITVRSGPTFLLEVGQMIPGTDYKIQGFKKKEMARADGTKEDSSEITLLDTKTNKTTVVVIFVGVIDGTSPR